MKAPFAFVLIAIMLSTFGLVCNLPYGLAATNGTNVNGSITKNTTWTLANSPYNITGNVTVNSGVTLTIQPGVEMISKNKYGLGVNGQDGIFEASLTVEGTLVAVGDNNNPIIFNDTTITFSNSSIGWNPQANSGSMIKRCFFEDADVKLDSSPKIDSNLFSGSTYSNGITTGGESTIYINGGSPVVSNNYMTNNSMQGSYGWSGDYDIDITNGNNATIIGNVIADGMFGISVDYPIAGFSFDSFSGTSNIENNLITNNKGAGINCGASFPLIMVNNMITQNYVGLDLGAFSSKSIIANNNIYNNTGIFDNVDRSVVLSSDSSQPVAVNASNNWWGTTDITAIGQPINNVPKTQNLGVVNFEPILSSPAVAPTIDLANHMPVNISYASNMAVDSPKAQWVYITIIILVAIISVLSLVIMFLYKSNRLRHKEN
jgi:hypothetical protein